MKHICPQDKGNVTKYKLRAMAFDEMSNSVEGIDSYSETMKELHESRGELIQCEMRLSTNS